MNTITVSELCALYAAERSPQVGVVVRRQIVPVLGHRRAADLAEQDVTQWLEAICQRYAPATVHTAFTALRESLRYGVRSELIATHPMDAMDVRKFAPRSKRSEEHRNYFALRSELEKVRAELNRLRAMNYDEEDLCVLDRGHYARETF